MIAHETIGMTNPIVPFHNIREHGKKYLPVKVIKEYISPAVSSDRRMINGSRKLSSQCPAHPV